jgi:hypothetical protein
MIPAVRAFEVAHDAIAGKRCHDAPCDVVIEREGNTYTVTFAPPTGGARPTPGEPTRVLVDASSGKVREVRNAESTEPGTGRSGVISAKRALEVGLTALRESQAAYDERWTTTIILVGDRYEVTFPVPESDRAAPLRADYALQVWVDSRTGKVVEIMHAA